MKSLSDHGDGYLEFNEEIDMENLILVVGMKFKNAPVFKQVVIKWNVKRWYDIC